MKAKKLSIGSAQAPQAIGPYSQGIVIGDLVYISGQIGADPAGSMVPGGVKEQTEAALRNIGALLAAARVSFQEVVKTTVYLKDMAGFAEMNDVYAKFFSAPYPARATIQVAGLPKNALVEIEAVAVRRDAASGMPV